MEAPEIPADKFCKTWCYFLYYFHTMVFHWSLSDFKSPQVTRTFLSIRANFNTAVVWMIFHWPSVHPFSFLGLWEMFQGHQLQLVSSLPSTAFSELRQDPNIGLFFCLPSLFTQWSAGMAKSTNDKFFFFWLINMRKSPRILCVLVSKTDSCLHIIIIQIVERTSFSQGVEYPVFFWYRNNI